MPDFELLNILNINCNTIDTEKEGKGANCTVSKDIILSGGSDQCFANKDSIFSVGSQQPCANTGPKRSCAKTNSNTNCYTNTENNSNSNRRPYNAFYQWSTIVRSNILFQAQAGRQAQTTMAIQT